ncbi:MAG: PTS transporter subunit EIIA [Spirochaetales bacterium]|nr:PTS transporter subunit EIIA [Spirochaetales bacterium]
MSDSPENEIMTLSEVASYLKIAEKTVSRMIIRGEIPCTKVASQWRFMKAMIDDWLISRMNVVPQNDLAKILENPEGLIPFTRITNEELIVPNLVPGTKRDILTQLIRPLVSQEIIEDPDDFLRKLLAREKMVTTGIGRGVAIPHLRHPRENPGGGPRMVVGICRPGTDYESIDGKLTHLFFLLVSDSEVVHLRVLAKLNQILREGNFVSRLIAASKEEVLDILVEGEKLFNKA